eukprot:scaffold181560_cov48-Prasinocladus_malaysianus.AAC.3
MEYTSSNWPTPSLVSPTIHHTESFLWFCKSEVDNPMFLLYPNQQTANTITAGHSTSIQLLNLCVLHARGLSLLAARTEEWWKQ